MKKEPLVSIGILCYNRPQGLKKALECITQQTYINLEIIISNNSIDNVDVVNVISEFAKKDSRVQYTHQKKNIGAVANFKFVLEKASGEYFMWAADDDYFESLNLISELSKTADTHILSFSDCSLSNTADGFIYNSYEKCVTASEYLLAWLKNGAGYPIYGLYNLKIMKDKGLEFHFDADLVYFNEGTMLHRLFLTGKVIFVPGVKIYFSQNSKKLNNFELCCSFLEYWCRTLKVFEDSYLNDVEKEQCIKVINKKYSKYYASVFISLSLKDRNNMSSKLKNQHNYLFLTKTMLIVFNVKFYLIKFPMFLLKLVKKIIIKSNVINYLRFKKEFKIFKKTNGDRFAVRNKDKYPILNEKGKTTEFDKH